MERVAWDVVVGLAASGHSIHIVTTMPPKGGGLPSFGTGVSIEYVAGTSPGRYSRAWWRGSRGAFLAHTGRDSFDVVFSVSASARSVLPLLNGMPAVMQAHGTSLGEFLSKLRSGSLFSYVTAWRNFMNIPRDISMFKRFSRIVAVGSAVYCSLQSPITRSSVRDRLTVIPNGVDVGLFSPDLAMRQRIRERLGIPTDARVVVWTSRLHRQKGCHLAVEAVATLKDSRIVLLVVGDGPEMRSLQRHVKRLRLADRVVFTGNVPSSGVPELLAAGDAFIFTTLRDEGLPLNVLEAMAMNLPCILSKKLITVIDGVESVEGIYPVDPFVSSEVAKGIVFALREHAAERRTFVERLYSKDLMVSRYEQLLTEVVHQCVG
jgi:glycosyltransferase involved in cell wall biosynthesis